MSTFYYVPQYFTTQLSVAGGIDDTQTTGIVLQSISGVDETKPGIIAVTWSNPIDTTKVEYITYTSINATTKELNGVTRGQEGYSAKSHVNGATVAWPLSKSHINNIPDSTTTFSNKTLTLPKINEDVVLTATSTQLNSLVSGSSDGWISAAETWTYASASTITVPSGAAAKYSKGDRIRWKQGAGYKYGVLTAVADTLLTIAVNTDYTVATPTAITDNYFSHQESPIGYPQYFNFTPSWTNLTPGAGTNTGNYSIIGKTLFMKVKFVFGGGSAIGAAEVKLTFPVTGAASNAGFISTTQIVDAGTATYLGLMDSSGVLFTFSTTVGYVSTASPMTWTTNDTLNISANYEIA